VRDEMNGVAAAMSHREPVMSGRRSRVRGFTLLEGLIVVAVIGLIVAIGYQQITKSIQRAKLDDTANNSLRLLIQRASTEMQRRGVATFVRIGPATASLLRVKLIADTTNDGVLQDPTDLPTPNPADTLVDSVDIPLGTGQQIALSSLDASQIESTRWEWQGAVPDWSDTRTDMTFGRLLMCDFQGRAIRPDTGLQIDQVATLRLTHVNALPPIETLQPPVRYELHISPLWNVTAIRQVKTSAGTWTTSVAK
jgi:prepilin-type N-terminal cleavage/methylation domain-containing protein